MKILLANGWYTKNGGDDAVALLLNDGHHSNDEVALSIFMVGDESDDNAQRVILGIEEIRQLARLCAIAEYAEESK